MKKIAVLLLVSVQITYTMKRTLASAATTPNSNVRAAAQLLGKSWYTGNLPPDKNQKRCPEFNRFQSYLGHFFVARIQYATGEKELVRFETFTEAKKILDDYLIQKNDWHKKNVEIKWYAVPRSYEKKSYDDLE